MWSVVETAGTGCQPSGLGGQRCRWSAQVRTRLPRSAARQAGRCRAGRDQTVDAHRFSSSSARAPSASSGGSRLGAVEPQGGPRRGYPAGSNPDRLIPREVEVLRLMAQGMSDRDIAETLFVGRSQPRKPTNRDRRKHRRRDSPAKGRWSTRVQ
ncbi:helix-turn-helix transcriptional regulator [Micromonospora polyrhachis]|uniref:helix-turn-helix transcriptional regulator n=1 Tax=Micromonospora polyrhachis TaxID=1282883 RepID=UPI0035E40FA0